MRKIFTLFLSFVFVNCFSQSVYTSSDYASTGDTFNITIASPSLDNFNSTGANHNWNYSNLKGASQQQIIFRDPKKTGYNIFTWPYLFIGNNVNLSSTNNQSISIAGFKETNCNNYFFKNNSSLSQKASSYSLAYNNISFDVKNMYSSADTLYKFPLNYGDNYASNAAYVTQFPGLYYIMQSIKRTNKVDGWGSLTTPNGSYANCLRIRSDVTEKDSFSLQGTGLPSITVNYVEFKWLDPSSGYPVLYVQQIKLGSIYITTLVQYLDKKQAYKPVAAFSYVPSAPSVKDTVTFQNLSTNSTSYLWNFGDGQTSTDVNPKHLYTMPGVYHVTLVAYNGSLTDTASADITVSGVLAVKLLSFTGSYNRTYNLLAWSASGDEGSKYNVQKSLDGTAFTTINSVLASKSNAVVNYSYKDANLLQGKNYYRLQTVDNSGAISYSNVVMLIADGNLSSALKVSPDPVNRGANLNVNISSSSSGNAVISVLNAEGKVVHSTAVNLVSGNNVFTLSTEKYAHGMYYVIVKGAATLSTKVLVQ